MNEQLKVVISAEVGKFKQNVDNAKKTVKDFIKEGTKDFSALNEAFQKVGDVSKKTLAVMGGAIAGTATALLALGASTREYRQQQAMLNTAFETAGGSAETAKTTYNDLFRVLGDSGQATEAAQHLAKLTTEEKALSEWTNICQGVYATFGESLPIESLTEAVNHSAKLGEVQGSLADALEWSGVSVDEFNEQLFWCNSESEREKLIRDTLNGLYDDAATNYEKNNEQILAQNEAQAKMNDAMAKLGEAMEPVNTMLMELGAKILADLTPYVTEFAEKYLPDIKEALSGVGEAIGKVITWIADNWELVSTLAVIIAGIAAAISAVSTALGIYNTVMAITSVVSLPVIGIIALIVAGIAALVTIIVLCVKHWDSIKAAGAKAVEALKNAWGSIANWFNTKVVQPIIKFFTGLWDKIKSIGSGIKDFFKNLFNFKWELPKLKLPKFSVKPAGWEIGDLLKGVIPKLGISWNARGGVFDKPTLFSYGGSLQGLGENGAEAVVPLENNLEWLNKLADMLSDRMGTNTPIVLQVDGKTFAKTAISTINNLTKQQGRLSLNIV